LKKKYSIQGIIGCILFGIGDWLLGFVDPASADGDTFYFISAGHGTDYPTWKITVTMICAVFGVLFLQQGCVHIADIMKTEKDRAGASRIFTFLTYAWLIIHFIVTIHVYVYSYICRNYGYDQAAIFSKDISKVLNPSLYGSYFVFIVAMIDLILVIARDRTYLRCREAFFTPLTWICLIGGTSMLLPECAFSKGLYTFCMNGGLLVWFIRMMLGKEFVTDDRKERKCDIVIGALLRITKDSSQNCKHDKAKPYCRDADGRIRSQPVKNGKSA
jgi:hypothetical protein